LHLRELERRTGVNSRHLLRELRSLHDAGLLIASKAGNQLPYQLNPDCPIVDELRSIIRKTVGIAAVLREILWPIASRIERAYIYGSTARGDAVAESDVDLMIVGDASLKDVSLLLEAQRSLRKEISPTLYGSDEYAAALHNPGSFVRRVHEGPRLNLFGRDS